MEGLLGRPLSEAEALLKSRGIPCRVTRYEAKRELAHADDWRVVRCAMAQGTAELVACRFATEFRDEESGF